MSRRNRLLDHEQSLPRDSAWLDEVAAFVKQTGAPVRPSTEKIQELFFTKGPTAAYMLVEKFESDCDSWAVLWDPPRAWVGQPETAWAHALFADEDEFLRATDDCIRFENPRLALNALLRAYPRAARQLVRDLAALDDESRRCHHRSWSRWTRDLHYFRRRAATSAQLGRLRGPRCRGAGRPAARAAGGGGRDGPDDPDSDGEHSRVGRSIA